tara:strand:+ start:289 stop:1176 length:888 start_codon:yes stop_codon:yes gene_type:complete
MDNISVIGSGTMGNGIAHVFAQNNYNVSLIDINEKALEKGLSIISKNLDRLIAKDKINIVDKERTLANIHTFSNIEDGVKNADLVIEAATENLSLKERIFENMDNFSPENAILATNTSSISITQLASKTKRPSKVIGMHFMNPVPIMKLVEVINGFQTDKQTTEKIVSLSKKIGKIPAMANDYPGFIANRILMPMINEAIYTLYEGVGKVEEIDIVMKLGMAHPMGPLQLADFIGLDVCQAILQVLYRGFGNSKYAPCPLLVNMVEAGQLGVKSGEGFYQYEKGRKELVVSNSFS